ncbi:UMP kinase [Mannheimia massilioguelmaensis]|uniref:UMP kinase n=1 Tax=Mannheimia massilioguelmaensis TaxID=1604354 RepID=UPI0005CAB7E5|nr:UMP kinase [Mannheimia massilioguelmaensis]
MSQPIYKRILLKLSGEALQGEEGFGIDPSILDRMALEIKELVEMGVEVGVVLGGGNLFRGAKLAKAGMNRVVGDHMGMLATVMNGLAMRDALHRADVNAKLMSAFQLNGICDTYNWSEAIKMLREKRVVIFSAGTGSPFFTTDSAACLRGIEIEANVVLKATKVDGVYDCDPAKNPNAKLFNQLTYAEVIDQELKVMDLAAFTLARDHNMPIRVFNMVKPGALRKVILGTDEGTTISG